MQRFTDAVIRFRTPVVLMTLIVSVWLASALPRLEVDSDILSYLPDSDPAVRLFDAVGTQFAGNSLAIVAVETEDVFTAHTIRTIHEITERVREVPDVTQVTSLTDVLDIREDEWGLEVARLIDKYDLPIEPDELAELKAYALGKDLYSGRVVSEDGTVALVIARVREGANRPEVAERIAAGVSEVNPTERIYYAGTPFQMRSIQRMILEDLRYLLPLVSFLLVLVLAGSFRSWVGVFLPLLTVLLSVVWSLGVMSLVRVPLTMVSNITPIVLVAVGSAYGIHFVSRFLEEPPDGGGRSRARRALLGVGMPIVLAGVTTLAGFLSFTGSYLTIIRYFGIFTALGVFFAMLLAVTFFPAVLSFGGGQGRAEDIVSSQHSTAVITRTMDRLGAFVFERPRLILVLFGIAATLSLLGLPRLGREVDMLKYFAPGSDIRISERMMEDKFGGSIPIQVSVHGDLSDPLVLKEIWALEKYLETVPAIYKPQSIANLIAEMNYVMNGRYVIPDTREEVTNLWFFLEGEESLEQLVDTDRSWGLIQANMASVNTADIRRIVARMDEYIANRLDTTLVSADLSQGVESLPRTRHRERIAQLVCDDVFSRRGTNFSLAREDGEAILAAHDGDKSLSLTLEERQSLEERVERFYSEDLAQAPVESVRGAARALGELGVASSPGIDRIEKALLELGASGGDQEAVRYDAGALEALVREVRGDSRADRALEKVVALLSQELQEDSFLLKRIRGNLWELNHENVLISVPSDGSTREQEISVEADQTGIPLIYKHLDDNLVTTQIVSLLVTALQVFLILSLQFRSFAAGVLGTVPLAFTVLINGVMSYLGVAVDMATVLVGSIAIGIGIDYTIHFLWRFQAEAQVHTQPLEALKATLETTGKAILINAVTVGLGFLVLLLASVVPIRNFGWLTALTMLSSATAALCVLPALILVLRPRFIGIILENNHRSNADAVGIRATQVEEKP